MCIVAPKSVTPHKEVQGSVYVLSKEEGRPPHAVLQWLPAAVLLPHDGRRVWRPSGRPRMVMPGDNVDMVVELITPIAMEKETSASPSPWGRSHRRRQRRREIIGNGGAGMVRSA